MCHSPSCPPCACTSPLAGKPQGAHAKSGLFPVPTCACSPAEKATRASCASAANRSRSATICDGNRCKGYSGARCTQRRTGIRLSTCICCVESVVKCWYLAVSLSSFNRVYGCSKRTWCGAAERDTAARLRKTRLYAFTHKPPTKKAKEGPVVQPITASPRCCRSSL